MALRCFLFSSDEGTVANLRQILDGLGVDAEPCPDAVKAAEKITNQCFQIVIIDWDQQPATFCGPGRDLLPTPPRQPPRPLPPRLRLP